MKIYTKSGDKLQTTTYKGRVYKSDLIIEVEGSLDEATSYLALARTSASKEDTKVILEKVIKKLFSLGSEFIGYTKDVIKEEDVLELENIIDSFDGKFERKKEFVIPGKTVGGANVHIARTAVRRLERRMVAYGLENEVKDVLYKYVNRLSDLLFTLGEWEDQ